MFSFFWPIFLIISVLSVYSVAKRYLRRDGEGFTVLQDDHPIFDPQPGRFYLQPAAPRSAKKNSLGDRNHDQLYYNGNLKECMRKGGSDGSPEDWNWHPLTNKRC